MNAVELYRTLNDAIPASLSLEWDNDGLMCCPDKEREINAVLCVLDVTNDAVSYAVENKFDVILSHHPLIFHPVKSLLSPKFIRLIRSGISVMSFHTRADRINGGINDLLAIKIGLEEIGSFAAGAGRIGLLKEPVLFDAFGRHLKNILGTEILCGMNACRYVYKAAVVSGSGSDFIGEAVSLGADTFITGECGYHSLLDAGETGINVFAAGHFFTERHAARYFMDLCINKYFGLKVELFEKNQLITI